MLKSKDSAIKLFGKTIPLYQSGNSAPVSDGWKSGGQEEQESKGNEPAAGSKDQDHELPDSEEKSELPPMPAATEEPSNKNSVAVHAEESTDTKNLKDKTPNKPEKILPCPRCGSMDAKFCYYNNYNVNQPRHFCKNCQRYWTAGGTMRNVPVGAGRRKISTSYHRHIITSSSSLQAVQQSVRESVRPPLLKPNGTVLSFGSESPLGESMETLLNLAEQTAKNCSGNGFHIAETCKEEKLSTGSLGSNTYEEATKTNKNCQHVPIPLPLPFLDSNAWAYPWRSHPALCSPSFAIPFYPAVPVPWIIPRPSSAAASPTSISKGAVNNPVTLGKHSRDVGDDLDEKDTRERRIWVPKTLRINDPDEAAKSSIWSMVGTKNDKERLLNAFQSKLESTNHTARSSQILHANPAALSRFLGFQESS